MSALDTAIEAAVERAMAKALAPLLEQLRNGGVAIEPRSGDDYLSLNEARRISHGRAETIRAAIDAKQLPAKHDPEANGGRGVYRIRRADLMAWLKDAK